jgi:hypothetical protein
VTTTVAFAPRQITYADDRPLAPRESSVPRRLETAKLPRCYEPAEWREVFRQAIAAAIPSVVFRNAQDVATFRVSISFHGPETWIIGDGAALYGKSRLLLEIGNSFTQTLFTPNAARALALIATTAAVGVRNIRRYGPDDQLKRLHGANVDFGSGKLYLEGITLGMPPEQTPLFLGGTYRGFLTMVESALNFFWTVPGKSHDRKLAVSKGIVQYLLSQPTTDTDLVLLEERLAVALRSLAPR